MDEVAFYRLEGQADSDVEVQASIRRGMISFAATRLVKVSTPYMRSGVLYDDFARGFGHEDPDLLVWRAPSTLMNPSLRVERLERERRLDPLRFAREYLADFAEDLEAFLPTAWVDQAVVAGRHELPPADGVRYVGAVDTSGGGADAFTLAVVHIEGDGAGRRIAQDVMRGWGRPRGGTVDLEGIVREISGLLKRYGLRHVSGDRYAAGWVVERFKAEGVRYELPQFKMPGAAEPTYLDKASAYLECEPLFAQGRIQLLDHPQLCRELKLLERRPRAGGRTLVDHPSGGHDDHANALAVAVAVAARQSVRPWAGARFPASAYRAGEPAAGGPAGRARGGSVIGQRTYVENWYR